MRLVQPYFERAWLRDQAGALGDMNWHYWMLPQGGNFWLPDWRRLLGRNGRHSRCELLRQYLVLTTGDQTFSSHADAAVMDAAKRLGIPI